MKWGIASPFRRISLAAAWLGSLAAVAASGCGDSPAEHGRLGAAHQAVFTGNDGLAAPDDMAHPQVAVLLTGTSCTGSLIASNVFLTAGHCVVGIPPGAKMAVNPLFPNAPPEIMLAFATAASAKPQIVTPFPGFAPPASGLDLAVIVFGASVPRNVLRPMRVASRPGVLLPSAPVLLGGGNTSLLDCGTTGSSLITMLFMSQGAIVPDFAANLSHAFDFGLSRPCKGDSGGPILESTSDEIISLGASNLQANLLYGPLLWVEDSPVRQWLVTNGLDRDGDGIEAVDDNCDTLSNASQTDTDQDGIGNVCDVCPYTAVEDDGDGDGVPDCADPCPLDGLDPLSTCGDTWGDTDCDGVCDVKDSCKYIANIQRANANSVAEVAWQAGAMGDACEPVPVPAGAPGPVVTLDQSSIQSSFVYDVYSHRKNDQIVVTPMRSKRSSSPSQGVTPPGTIQTDVRFCQRPADPLDRSCTHPLNVAEFRLLPTFTASTELPSEPYHRISASFSSQRGASIHVSYDGTPQTWTWDYQADVAFWTDPAIFPINPLIDIGSPESNGIFQGSAASGLNGTIWVHGATAYGHPGNPSNNLGTGTHGGPNIADTHELASSYHDQDPEFTTHVLAGLPLALAEPFFIWRTLPDPIWRMKTAVGVRPTDDYLLVQTAGSDWGLVNPDGTAEIVTERLGAGLRTSMQDATLVWANAVESSFAMGDASAPLAIALSADGTGIHDTMALSAEGDILTGDTDRGAPPRTTGASPTPSARTAFTAVYSRFFRSAYVMGGMDVETGTALHDLHRFDLPTNNWIELPLSLALGRVIAATVSYRNGGLYVLDEISVGEATLVRLIKLDPLRGGGEIVHTWAPSGGFERHWLGLDTQGNLLLMSSSAANNEHTVIWIEIGPTKPTNIRLWTGGLGLQWPVMADDRGLSFFLRDGANVQVVRQTTLGGSPISWDAAGAHL